MSDPDKILENFINDKLKLIVTTLQVIAMNIEEINTLEARSKATSEFQRQLIITLNERITKICLAPNTHLMSS